MPTERANRLALNEAMFRVANERMKAWKEWPDPVSRSTTSERVVDVVPVNVAA